MVYFYPTVQRLNRSFAAISYLPYGVMAEFAKTQIPVEFIIKSDKPILRAYFVPEDLYKLKTLSEKIKPRGITVIVGEDEEEDQVINELYTNDSEILFTIVRESTFGCRSFENYYQGVCVRIDRDPSDFATSGICRVEAAQSLFAAGVDAMIKE